MISTTWHSASYAGRATLPSCVRSLPRWLSIIAKIEKDAALHNIDAIVRAADGVMVARGDLGVELPFEEVPMVQKRIIRLANHLGRPVITATQMLKSMVEKPRPTRAEASDVANAILDGTDAVMLSAETATGEYPRLAVGAMRRIILEVEGASRGPRCATICGRGAPSRAGWCRQRKRSRPPRSPRRECSPRRS